MTALDITNQLKGSQAFLDWKDADPTESKRIIAWASKREFQKGTPSIQVLKLEKMVLFNLLCPELFDHCCTFEGWKRYNNYDSSLKEDDIFNELLPEKIALYLEALCLKIIEDLPNEDVCYVKAGEIAFTKEIDIKNLLQPWDILRGYVIKEK